MEELLDELELELPLELPELLGDELLGGDKLLELELPDDMLDDETPELLDELELLHSSHVANSC